MLIRMYECFDNKVPFLKMEDGYGAIYLYTTPFGQYVGQTTKNMRRRHNCHMCRSLLIDMVLREYPYHYMLIGIYPTNQLDYKEKLFVRVFDTLYPHGFNMHEGGAGWGGLSDYSKQKMRDNISKRYIEHPEIKDSISQKVKQHYIDNPDERERMSHIMKTMFIECPNLCMERGKRLSEFHKNHPENLKKASKARWEKYRNDTNAREQFANRLRESIRNNPEKHRLRVQRQIEATTKNGRAKRIRCVETGEEFVSIRDAYRQKKYGSSNLNRALNNPNMTAYGYHWERV